MSLLLQACGWQNSQKVIEGRQVFIMSQTQNIAGKLENTMDITGLSSNNGQTNWKHQVPWLSGWHEDQIPAIAHGVMYTVEDDATNPSSPSGFVTARSVTDGREQWKVEIGALASSPLVVNDVVYLSAIQYTQKQNMEKWVYALNSHSGKQIWQAQITSDFGLNDTLKLVDGKLYISSNQVCFDVCAEAFLFVLDVSKGKVIWTKDIPVSQGDTAITSFTMVNDVLYVVFKEHFYAFQAKDGHDLWKYETHFPYVYQAPYPVIINDLVYLVSATAQDEHDTDAWSYALFALEGKSGRTRWQKPVDLEARVVASDNHAVYISGKRVTGTKTLTEGKGAGRTVNTYAYTLTAVRASDGEQLWQKRSLESTTTAVEKDGILYVTRKDDSETPEFKVVAWHVQDGSAVWQKTYDNIAEKGVYIALPPIMTIEQGMVYVSSGNKMLFAIQAKDGNLIWKMQADGVIRWIMVAE